MFRSGQGFRASQGLVENFGGLRVLGKTVSCFAALRRGILGHAGYKGIGMAYNCNPKP